MSLTAHGDDNYTCGNTDCSNGGYCPDFVNLDWVTIVLFYVSNLLSHSFIVLQ